jgi:uncharacterized membrane protein SpoIIM required for sporulation/uncharacterized RDD family membrane protein YckC
VKDRVAIATPDNVALDFEVAGAGSRFLALLVDTAVWVGLLLLVILLLGIRSAVPSAGRIAASAGWIKAVLILALFLTRWGYYIFFEILLAGRTPGKMALGIRVVRENGLPPEPRQVLIRNLLRAVDMLPPPLYLVGGLSLLISSKGQRLGDLAAGTMVIRERFRAVKQDEAVADYGASWMAKLQRGLSQYALVLPKGKITIRQIALIEAYFSRRDVLPEAQRDKVARQIIRPLLPLFEQESAEWEGEGVASEKLMQEVMERAKAAAAGVGGAGRIAEDAEKKARTWKNFSARIDWLLRRGRAALRMLSSGEMKRLLVDYRRITTDLARAQSMQADPQTLSRLNRLAIRGHNVLYRYQGKRARAGRREWLGLFAREVRESFRAVALSAGLFFAAALVSALAVLWQPGLAFDLVGPEFYDFSPTSQEHLHDIPKIVRPVAASFILTNNLQVTILAFAFGMTAGLGTAFLLVNNGMHLGSVIGWMSLQGSGRALWGWVMPHGATEILAVIIAGAAGFLLARGILLPGQLRRGAALKLMGRRALVLELGCMAMLVVAGLIEGFISPSRIGFSFRILILAASVLLWVIYFALAGRRRALGGAG